VKERHFQRKGRRDADPTGKKLGIGFLRDIPRCALALMEGGLSLSAAEQLPLFRLPPAQAPAKVHHVQLGSRIVSYTVRPARRRMSLNIDERGLRVGLPRGMALSEVETFIRRHGEWVLTKLDEYGSRETRRQILLHDGQRLPLLGGEVVLRIGAGNNRFRWYDSLLELQARPQASIDALTRRALQTKALEVFAQRLAYFAELGGYELPALSLSSARTRWGSCSSESGIRLNWRLIHLSLDLIDYVVCHELAHLRQMNHSPRFWSEVAKLCPDWQDRRQTLKQEGLSLPLL
jgi:predicted metal-dependent hydrolase